MRRIGRLLAVVALVLIGVFAPEHATGQTMVDMRSQARNIDFSNVGSTRPFTVGTSLPPVCTLGQTFFNSGALPGRNLYLCTATNIWTAQSADSSLVPTFGNAGKLLGNNGSLAGWRTLAGFTDNGSRLVADGTVFGQLGANNVWIGHQRYPASPVQTLTGSGNTITCNRRTVAVSALSELTLSSTATIPVGSDGQVCVIVNVGQYTVTLQDEDALPSTKLQLNALALAIPPKAQVTLQFSAAVNAWIQDGIAQASSSSGGAIAWDAELLGLVARTDSGTTVGRALTGANGISVVNGSGASGDPQIVLPGSSKGDLIVHNGSTNSRFSAGANGQILTADSAAASGVRWGTRSISGLNGVVATNGNWSNGDSATLSLPGSVKGDLMVHNGSTNVRQPAGANGSFLQYDNTQSSGLASAYAPVVRKCAAGTDNGASTSQTSLGNVMLTGLQAGGMVKYYTRFQTTGVTTGIPYLRFQFGGQNLMGAETSWISPGNSLVSVEGTIHLVTSSSQLSEGRAVTAGLETSSGAAVDTQLQRPASMTVDISGGSALLDFAARTTDANRTIKLAHYCVEYYPAVP